MSYMTFLSILCTDGNGDITRTVTFSFIHLTIFSLFSVKVMLA